KFPKTIFFKDSRVLYNTVSDEVKEVNDLDIFNEADSINKTLYLLMSSFIIEESKNKKLKFKDKNELKKMFINELKSEQAFMGELKTSDEQLMSKLESLVDRVFLKEIKNNSWGGGLFSAINEFLKKTKRSVTR
ncbi:TPA: hypothetical protein N2W92_004774, partial [Escherichia coli]|nr:hypothetical protein [Escherichia coli]